MPSPFPGMNPYLEQEGVWHDFHERAIPLFAELLAEQVDPDYIVKIDEHVFIHELSADERRLAGRADISLAASGREPSARGQTASISAPAEVGLPQTDVERLSFIEIRDRSGGDVVTVIELLSPANKRHGPDREQYLGKRLQLLRSNTHFVEIDLLRGGPRLPLERLPECDYYVMVSRVERRPKAEIWPIRLREALPEIPVPLRPGDADARLGLQAALNRVYDAARYRSHIYRGEPNPPLRSEDAIWARGLAAVGG